MSCYYSGKTQELDVHALNEGDRNSSAVLKIGKKPELCLGDLVPFFHQQTLYR
ncbi:hypothetical protein Bca101_077592 [Brassica carinata]